jgi:hypothetical protein
MESKISELYLSAVLEKLSAHLDFLSGQVFNVEHELGEMVSGSNGIPSLSIAKLQSLDFTRQSLEDCALLLCLLSNEVNAETSIVTGAETIRRNLKLEKTRNLLANCNGVELEEEAGKIDLF